MPRHQPFYHDRRCELSTDDRRATLRANAPSRPACTAWLAPSIIRNRALVAFTGLALAGCAGGSHTSEGRTTQQLATETLGSPGATPFGVMSPAAVPEGSAAPPAASAAPSAAASAPSVAASAQAAPVASAAPLPAATAAPSPAVTSAPRILSVHTSPAVVHDGDTLLWDVRTTPDVVDVVAHVTAYAFRLQKQSSGEYVLTFTIPHGVPGFFHGNYTLDLVARSVTGVETTTKVPVSFQ